MLTIAPVVLAHHRRKDGTYNVKIRVTWKGRSAYVATNLFCSKDDLTRSLNIKTPAIIDAAARLVGELRESVSGLSPALMENLTAAEIVARMKGARAAGSFRLDLLEYGRRLASRKTPSTARAYTMALGALERWLGRPGGDAGRRAAGAGRSAGEDAGRQAVVAGRSARPQPEGRPDHGEGEQGVAEVVRP